MFTKVGQLMWQDLRPGDILLQVRNRELIPPEPPIFPVGDDSQYRGPKTRRQAGHGDVDRSVS